MVVYRHDGKKEDLMSKIDYIGADNGGLALYAGNVTIRATTVEAVAEAMKNHGLAETVMGSSSMDFASEEGFETDDGALNMWNEAIGIYNWEVNGVAS
tara:strand:- start:251 stop:544 length:294 start_codon:yes stop_codon:yes gene_type:complete